MSKSDHMKDVAKIFGSVKVYTKEKNDWCYLRPTDIGDIKYSVRTNDHNNWLICDGRSLSREDFSDLFDVIGTSFGNNDSTTFKLPDTRGRVLGAVGTGTGLSARTMGQTVGEEQHTLSVNQIPSHTHSINDPGHSHTWNRGTEGDDSGNGGSYNEFTQISGSNTDVIASATTGITINATGGGQAFNVMQPTSFIGNVFIYAKYRM